MAILSKQVFFNQQYLVTTMYFIRRVSQKELATTALLFTAISTFLRPISLCSQLRGDPVPLIAVV